MIERKLIGGDPYIKGYHTQEFRHWSDALTEPIPCTKNNAWLGIGAYFWLDIEFAHLWGVDSKTATGAYDIYDAWVPEKNLINATFSEEGYFFFREKIELAMDYLKSQGFKNLELYKVHKYLSEEIWPDLGVEGIIFDDIPQNNAAKGRTYTEIPPLHYKKRLQVVLYNTENLSNFDLYLENQEI